MSLNLTHGEVYLIQHYVMKCVNEAGQWFYSGTLVSSNKQNWSPGYDWNIVGSGIKNYNPSHNPYISAFKYNLHIILDKTEKELNIPQKLFFVFLFFWITHEKIYYPYISAIVHRRLKNVTMSQELENVNERKWDEGV